MATGFALCVIVVSACSDITSTTEEPPSTPAPQESDATQESDSTQAPARALVDALARGAWSESVADFDTTMRGGFSEAQMEALWVQLTTTHGAFKEVAGVVTMKAGEYDAVMVECTFERGKQVLQVTVDSSGQVAGLFIR